MGEEGCPMGIHRDPSTGTTHWGLLIEHEQLFDVLRKNGPEVVGDHRIEVGGTSSWKTLIVSSEKTGEVVVEKKFYKADFDEILKNPEYKGYLDSLVSATFIRKNEPSLYEIDQESYEEVRSVALELEDDLISGI